jgi:hypothetical protein
VLLCPTSPFSPANACNALAEEVARRLRRSRTGFLGALLLASVQPVVRSALVSLVEHVMGDDEDRE